MTRQSAAYAATAALSLIGALLAFGQAVTLACYRNFRRGSQSLRRCNFASGCFCR